uniref:protein-serine/threonine phosphatase n=1 Tax=Cannabis sativa TaxID=3483 RepID=A0A803PGY5_CANSA
MAPTPNVCLKRKRPPSIEIPNVLGEIRMENSTTPRNDGVSFGEVGVGVFSRKGKKKFMEDTHKIASCLQDNPNKRFFFGVYDGHGGKKAAEFVAENLHNNVLEMMKNCDEKEEGVKAGYLKTDQDFLKQDICSGACCVTAVIEEGDEVIVSNVGDCRAVLCRGGVAEALTKDHTVEKEEERNRIEAKGGYVEIHRGAWRVHGVLTVSRSIGDAHLKDWVLAEPETKILKLTPDMDFLILASDGLWEKVGNQEAIDTVKQSLCSVEKKLGPSSGDYLKENDYSEYGLVNVSPSSKLRRVSLVKQAKKGLMITKSPSYKKTSNNNGLNLKNQSEHDFIVNESESPPSKSRRISLAKRVNSKMDSPTKLSSKELVAACKELVNLAVNKVIPACFSSGERPQADDPAAVIRSGQSVFMSVYRTKIAGQCRLITITWCKNLLLRGLSVSIQGVQDEEDEQYQCKVELKPWYFWRKNGDKQFVLDGTIVNVAWDLKAAKFNGETEPQSDYYVAIVCEEEVVLLVGDMKKDAFRKTGCRPSLIDPILVSRKEHLFGKRKFSTRVKFHEKANSHEILIECNNSIIPSYDSTTGMISTGSDPELEVQVDGKQVLHVKHLQWKFRGNESVFVSKTKVEVYWDVHDWLFSSGTRHAKMRI